VPTQSTKITRDQIFDEIDKVEFSNDIIAASQNLMGIYNKSKAILTEDQLKLLANRIALIMGNWLLRIQSLGREVGEEPDWMLHIKNERILYPRADLKNIFQGLTSVIILLDLQYFATVTSFEEFFYNLLFIYVIVANSQYKNIFNSYIGNAYDFLHSAYDANTKWCLSLNSADALEILKSELFLKIYDLYLQSNASKDLFHILLFFLRYRLDGNDEKHFVYFYLQRTIKAVQAILDNFRAPCLST
jgi:hypothetical protein